MKRFFKIIIIIPFIFILGIILDIVLAVAFVILSPVFAVLVCESFLTETVNEEDIEDTSKNILPNEDHLVV